jgi:hypothetical protein
MQESQGSSRVNRIKIQLDGQGGMSPLKQRLDSDEQPMDFEHTQEEV